MTWKPRQALVAEGGRGQQQSSRKVMADGDTLFEFNNDELVSDLNGTVSVKWCDQKSDFKSLKTQLKETSRERECR